MPKSQEPCRAYCFHYRGVPGGNRYGYCRSPCLARGPVWHSPISIRFHWISTVASLAQTHGQDNVRGFRHGRDTGRKPSSRPWIDAVKAFGGMDIVVNMPGSRLPQMWKIQTLELWNKNMSIMATRLFPRGARGLPADEKTGAWGFDGVHCVKKCHCSPLLEHRPIVQPKPQKSIWHAAWRLKARHLVSGLNVVNPDAVLRGSKIWQGENGASNDRIKQDQGG